MFFHSSKADDGRHTSGSSSASLYSFEGDQRNPNPPDEDDAPPSSVPVGIPPLNVPPPTIPPPGFHPNIRKWNVVLY